MKKFFIELGLILLSTVMMLFIIGSSPEKISRKLDSEMIKEIEEQKRNHIGARRELRKNEKNLLKTDKLKNEDNTSESFNTQTDNNKNIVTSAQNKEKIFQPVINIKTEDGEIIDINTADISSLCKIKGVGEKTAGKIIEYREKNGYFFYIDDLKKISGIGEKKLSKIKESNY